MTAGIEIQVACSDDDIPSDQDLSRWVFRALDSIGCDEAGAVAVRIVDVDEMRALNRDFRGKDRSTNVLAFPAGAVEGLPEETECPLGDIVVCASVVRDEARAQGKALGDHWAHMLVHGSLHLLGYDHVTDELAIEMETLEKRILGDHGIADPYAESRRRN